MILNSIYLYATVGRVVAGPSMVFSYFAKILFSNVATDNCEK